MVILGGLEIVAAGYIIHKHQQNKRDKARLAEEAAALEEQQYRIFPNDGRQSSSQHRRRRSRHSHDRRHSCDGRDCKYKRESPRPSMKPAAQTMPVSRPPPYNTVPVAMPQQRPPQQQQRPVQQQASAPVPQMTQQPPQQYSQDIKYGWTDDNSAAPHPPASDSGVVTGWPSHWEQSRQGQRGESSRGRSDRRPESPRVRFAESLRSESRTPPPSYRG